MRSVLRRARVNFCRGRTFGAVEAEGGLRHGAPAQVGGAARERPVKEAVETQASSIVLVGKFNPAIFSPGWLAKYGFISDEQMEGANVTVVHPEVTQFTAGGYGFDVNQQRCMMRSEQEPFTMLLELAVGIFGNHLTYTPLQKLGINLHVTYSCRSAKQRIELGRVLAPLAPWGKFGKRIEDSPVAQTGGILSMTMQENNLPDRKSGHRRVEVEADNDAGRKRVMIGVNDHFELLKPDDVEGSAEIIAILQDRFDASIAESRRIINELIEVSNGLPQ